MVSKLLNWYQIMNMSVVELEERLDIEVALQEDPYLHPFNKALYGVNIMRIDTALMNLKRQEHQGIVV